MLKGYAKWIGLAVVIVAVLAIVIIVEQLAVEEPEEPVVEAPQPQEVEQKVIDPTVFLDALVREGRVFSSGPGGEHPTSAGEVSLTEEELQQIREMNATAAIVMHYKGNDWSMAQVAGMTAQFEKMGIEVVAVTDAGFRPEDQVADIESVLAMEPDIIVSIPTDPVAVAPAFKKAAEAGVKLVFMDNVPHGMVQGEDYISVVSADNFGNGVASAHLMAKYIGGEGKIGVIYHEADFFVTRQRFEAFIETISDYYHNIEIVERIGITGPDFAGDAEEAASAMLVEHKDLKGIWAVWDVPAEGVMAAARAMDRTDIVITTIDLGLNVAIDIAKEGMVKGLGAQRPFDQGVTQAKLAGYGLLGKEAPAFVALYMLPVNRDNILEAWEIVYRTEPHEMLTDAIGN